jgi:MFS family permease
MAGKKKWLNPTVIGASLTSFLSDLSHESVTVLLPALMVAMGAPPYALGLIEGISDGLASFAKLFSGYLSDKLGKHKEFATAGYVLTGFFPAIVAISISWPMVLFGKAFGWFGKGIRGPARDAILSKSVEREDLGKAFGLHRTGDTLGAIAGPAIAFFLISYVSLTGIFWLALVPGLLAAIVFWFFVKEKNHIPSGNHKTIIASLETLPKKFKGFLGAVLIFGVADFSHTMLIAFAVAMLAPSLGLVQAAAAGILLYIVRNIVYAIASYPFGALGDKYGRVRVLGFGYFVATLTFIGFILSPLNILAYALLFAMAGLFIAAEDALEGAIAGELVETKDRGLGYGALATVNGIGDFASSIIVGFIWAILGFGAGFVFCAIVAAIGTVAILDTKTRQ